MDSKLLLIHCITLLYRESELKESSGSGPLCQQVVETIKLPDSSVSLQTGREVIVGLRSTVHWMLDHREKSYDKTQLLQRVRVNTKDESHLYNALNDAIQPMESEDKLKEQILSYRKSLREHLNAQQITTILAQAYSQVGFGNDPNAKIDYREFVREVYDKLEPFTHDIIDSKHPSVIDHASFASDEEIVDLLSRSKEEISADGVLKTGYQAFNRLLGSNRGFRRGEFAVIGALQHNYKTGFTLNLFKHFALYNKPYMRDPSKKPMLFHVSLENELPMNIMELYANLKENETGEICDKTMVDPAEAAKYIRERMGVNGYHIEMVRLEPGQCSYHDFFDMILRYEAEGYEIHAVICDYLNMMNKKGLDRGGPAGEDIRQLFRVCRNFFAPRGITFITPHQLSTEAKMVKRGGIDNFVQYIANGGFYDGSKRIDQEVDLEVYIDISKIPGDGSYLNIQRGKHRGVNNTPEKDLYTVLPFRPAGGVCDDLLGEDTSRSSAGGASMAQGGGDWFDL
tara:strand:+ start:1568 stop:3103 length:1536 start_codon:yes stop_codon:yes gene_type:complete